jgi:hypothetical protein
MADAKPTIDYTKWLPIGISAVALMVSIGALSLSYFSYQTTHVYSEINIQPDLETDGQAFVPPTSHSYLVNRGRGPAYLSKVEFRYDEQPYTALAIAEIFLEAQRQYNSANNTDFRCRFTVGNLLYTGVDIRPGERVVLWTTQGDCPQGYQWAFMRSFSLMIEYKSLTGKVHKLEIAGDPSRIPESEKSLRPLAGPDRPSRK